MNPSSSFSLAERYAPSAADNISFYAITRDFMTLAAYSLPDSSLTNRSGPKLNGLSKWKHAANRIPKRMIVWFEKRVPHYRMDDLREKEMMNSFSLG